MISCTAAFAISLKLATSVCLFSVKLSQGLKVSAAWEIIEEIYSSSQAISLRIWGLFRRYLLSVTTGPWSHQHFHARSQQLTFSEMTSDHWSLIWRNCSLPVHTYYSAWKSDLENADSGGHWPLGKYRASCVCLFQIFGIHIYFLTFHVLFAK